MEYTERKHFSRRHDDERFPISPPYRFVITIITHSIFSTEEQEKKQQYLKWLVVVFKTVKVLNFSRRKDDGVYANIENNDEKERGIL